MARIPRRSHVGELVQMLVVKFHRFEDTAEEVVQGRAGRDGDEPPDRLVHGHSEDERAFPPLGLRKHEVLAPLGEIGLEQ